MLNFYFVLDREHPLQSLEEQAYFRNMLCVYLILLCFTKESSSYMTFKATCGECVHDLPPGRHVHPNIHHIF